MPDAVVVVVISPASSLELLFASRYTVSPALPPVTVPLTLPPGAASVKFWPDTAAPATTVTCSPYPFAGDRLRCTRSAAPWRTTYAPAGTPVKAYVPDADRVVVLMSPASSFESLLASR